MMQCSTSLPFLVLSVVVVSLSSRPMVQAWKYQTRSSCANTYEDCSNEWGCCKADDVCVTLHDEVLDESMTIAPRRCQTIYRYPHPIARNGKCDDSHQCYDRCCQVYRGYRYGTSYRCGPQNEGRIAHDCVVKRFY